MQVYFKLNSGLLPSFMVKTANIILPSIHVKTTYVFQVKPGTPTEFYTENSKPPITADDRVAQEQQLKKYFFFRIGDITASTISSVVKLT